MGKIRHTQEPNVHKTKKSGRIIIRKELCWGCGICELACSLYHEKWCSPSLSRISVKKNFLELDFEPEVCIQCEWPSCYYECPVGAIAIDMKNGARFIDPNQCTGCSRCVKVCPIMPDVEAIKYKESGKTRIYFKCDLCRGRNEGPLCVAVCPRNALRYDRTSEGCKSC